MCDFIQMAHEYRLAMLLIREELSFDVNEESYASSDQLSRSVRREDPHAKIGQSGPMRGHGKCPVTICAELTTTEFLTITVSVSNVGSERDICECGVSKAKDFARQF